MMKEDLLRSAAAEFLCQVAASKDLSPESQVWATVVSGGVHLLEMVVGGAQGAYAGRLAKSYSRIIQFRVMVR